MRLFCLLSIALWPFGTGREGAPIKKTSFDLPQSSAEFSLIKISLLSPSADATVAASAAFQILDLKGNVLASGSGMAPVKVRTDGTGIILGAKRFAANPLVIQSKAGSVKVNSGNYRYGIEVWIEKGNKISIVNELPIDDYLKGVLPWEANPKWPLDALKAQAITSRTYALFKAIENKDQRFFLTQDVLSQVYKGRSIENPLTNLAIQATKGAVLTYKSKIFPAYFHSTCGGATTHAEYLWDVEPNPVLTGVKCNFCTASKHYRWTQAIPVKEIETKLIKKGVKVSAISNVEADDKDATGRTKSFLITYSGGKQVRLHANDFRLWLDPAKLKSTLIISITKQGSTFTFRGRGWGHGVGLCQYGMKQLAEMGYDTQKILKFYYPGAEITFLDRPDAGAAKTEEEDERPGIVKFLEENLGF
jgi:stage II sporulation protein D